MAEATTETKLQPDIISYNSVLTALAKDRERILIGEALLKRWRDFGRRQDTCQAEQNIIHDSNRRLGTLG
jgi:hypothetical protein